MFSSFSLSSFLSFELKLYFFTVFVALLNNIFASLAYFNACSLLTINCSLFSVDEIEAELFGESRVESSKIGLLELAHNGILYIDEIASIPLSIQQKFLDSIQKGNFYRVNGDSLIYSDFKIVTSSCKNLQHLVESGKFNEKLYYLLKSSSCIIPPLRARIEDIMPIAQYYLRYYNSIYHKRISGFSRDTLLAMETYHWPGNNRELANLIEMALLKADSDLLDPAHLGLTPSGKTVENEIISSIVSSMNIPLDQEPIELEMLLQELESILVSKAMSIAGGNKSKAARFLGLNRDKIRYRLKALDKE